MKAGRVSDLDGYDSHQAHRVSYRLRLSASGNDGIRRRRMAKWTRSFEQWWWRRVTNEQDNASSGRKKAAMNKRPSTRPRQDNDN